jgi:hypothetical protein
MSSIPLHIERRFEQRWVARFFSPVASAAPKSTDLKGTLNNLPRPRPAIAKEKPAGAKRRAPGDGHLADL